MFEFASNLPDVEARLTAIALRQMPYAAALALNDTAQDVQDAERAEIGWVFDRPTPFTENAFAVKRASKETLTASVVAKPIQAAYLGLQVTGGTRRPKKKALVVPVGANLNAFGNLPRKAVARMLANKDNFIASQGNPRTAHLPPGIYKRGLAGKRKAKAGGGYGTKGRNVPSYGKGRSTLTQLVAWEPDAQYSPLFPFHQVAAATAMRSFGAHFARRWSEAVASAK